MYIGSSSLKNLAMFLQGFTHAAYKVGVRDHTLSHFQEWVEKRFDIHVSRGWWEIIEFHSGDGAEALNSFWKLFDEYLEQSSGTADRLEQEAIVRYSMKQAGKSAGETSDD